MDDVLLIYADIPNWDARKFCDDFAQSTCYHPPLNLVDGQENTFLETRFQIQGDMVHHWLKNDNETHTKVWRYQLINTSSHMDHIYKNVRYSPHV